MLTLVALLLAAQEPAPPETPPPAADAPPQQPSEEQLLAAIEKVRGSYDSADERVRTGVETPVADASARGAMLLPAEQALQTLVADLEALIEILPKPPS